jgi:hypothetical protein
MPLAIGSWDLGRSRSEGICRWRLVGRIWVWAVVMVVLLCILDDL